MAQQVGPFYITGCYHNVCFYRMEGKYYARSKSSLEGKRVKKDPAFFATMRYAGWLGRASKIAALVYKSIPAEKKKNNLFRVMTGKALLLLKEGKMEEEVVVILNGVYNQQEKVVCGSESTEEKNCFAEEVLYKVFRCCINDDKAELVCEGEGLPQ